MKPTIVRAAFTALLLAVAPSYGEPKGETVKLKGEVIDVWCYLEGDDHGAEHKKCAVACAKAGNPIGLLTEKGDVYVLVGIKDHDPDKDALIAKMAADVTVEGTLVKKGGTQLVYVSKIE